MHRYLGLAFLFVGCADPQSGVKPEGPGSGGGDTVDPGQAPEDAGPTSVDPGQAFVFRPAYANGVAAPDDTFSDEDLVFLAASGNMMLSGEMYFYISTFIRTPSGAADIVSLTSAGKDCYGFTLGQARIVGVPLTANNCQHVSSQNTVDGGLTIKLEPFDDVRDSIVLQNGARVYNVRVAPMLEGPFGEHSYGFSFRIKPDAPPVCGNGIAEDGEECDDGNTDCSDGCTTECKLED